MNKKGYLLVMLSAIGGIILGSLNAMIIFSDGLSPIGKIFLVPMIMGGAGLVLVPMIYYVKEEKDGK